MRVQTAAGEKIEQEHRTGPKPTLRSLVDDFEKTLLGQTNHCRHHCRVGDVPLQAQDVENIADCNCRVGFLPDKFHNFAFQIAKEFAKTLLIEPEGGVFVVYSHPTDFC